MTWRASAGGPCGTGVMLNTIPAHDAWKYVSRVHHRDEVEAAEALLAGHQAQRHRPKQQAKQQAPRVAPDGAPAGGIVARWARSLARPAPAPAPAAPRRAPMPSAAGPARYFARHIIDTHFEPSILALYGIV